MKLPNLKLAAAAATLISGAWLTSSAPLEGGAGIEYTFREAPLNSLGVLSLADLRGKPVLIEFWGKN